MSLPDRLFLSSARRQTSRSGRLRSHGTAPPLAGLFFVLEYGVTCPMAVTSNRRLETTSTRRFGSGAIHTRFPDLTEIQTKSYARFLQYDSSQEKRKDEGLEGVCARSFRSRATTRSSSSSYLRYELGKPRYEPDECRQLRLTYGGHFASGCGSTRSNRLTKKSIWAICRSCWAAANSSSTARSVSW